MTQIVKQFRLGCFLFVPLVILNISLQAQCNLTCKTNVEVTLDTNGMAIIYPGDILDGISGFCPGSLMIDISGPLSDTVFCSELGDTLLVLLTHEPGSESCIGSIIVTDPFGPIITCPPDITMHCDDPFDDTNISGNPTLEDNCGGYSFFNDNTSGLNNCNQGILERSWIGVDSYGNMDTCIQLITLIDTLPPLIIFPDDLTIDCSQNPNDISLTLAPIFLDECASNQANISKTDTYWNNCPPGEYRVSREWEVLDWCNYDPMTNEGVYAGLQWISVIDTTPPIIQCIQDITVATGAGSCQANAFIPNSITVDNCTNVSLIKSYSDGSGYIPFFGNNVSLGVGTYSIQQLAEDDCGNQSFCYSNLTVLDLEPPVSICDQSLSISLAATSYTPFYATTLDGGSADNCGIDTVLISRDGFVFGDRIFLDCNDAANSPVFVFLRSYDIHGNYNDCSAYIEVNDHISPVLNCPADITISCLEDRYNLSLTGEGSATDDCGVSLIYEDYEALDNCDLGSINRVWLATDNFGNTSTCPQHIFIEDPTLPVIEFPTDTTIICNTSTDPIATGRVAIFDECSSFGSSHSDQLFYINPPSNFRIIRTWEVLNWCDQFFESSAVQIIDVIDTIAPEIVCLNDTIFATADGDCSAYVSLEIDGSDNCSPTLIFHNDSPYADADGKAADGVYPVGIHPVEFTVTDITDNTSSCQVVVVVRDQTLPTPVCINGLSLNLGTNGSVSITPSIINQGSFDNCTSNQNLIVSITPNLFDCSNIGNNLVTLNVVDEAGNANFCTANLLIQDNLGNCPDLADLAGLILNEEGQPVGKTNILLKQGDSNQNQEVNTNGYFEFPNLQTGENYEIIPDKNIGHGNGISTFDLLLIRRHILDLGDLDSPYKIIAADINNSGSVSTYDILLLRKVLLNLSDNFPNNSSWRFVPADYIFTNPLDPFIDNFSERIIINPLVKNELETDFVGIKVGDVNLSGDPSEVGNGSQSRTVVTLEIKDRLLNADETDIVWINSSENVLFGFQFTLNFGADIEILEVVDGSLDLRAEHSNKTSSGIIHFSWDNPYGKNHKLDEPLFGLKVKANKTNQLSSSISLERNSTHEIYTDIITPKNLALSINYNSKDLSVTAAPNPFRHCTTIEFSQEEDGFAELVFEDINGQKIDAVTKFFPRGVCRYDFCPTIPLSQGIIFCHIKSGATESYLKLLHIR